MLLNKDSEDTDLGDPFTEISLPKEFNFQLTLFLFIGTTFFEFDGWSKFIKLSIAAVDSQVDELIKSR